MTLVSMGAGSGKVLLTDAYGLGPHLSSSTLTWGKLLKGYFYINLGGTPFMKKMIRAGAQGGLARKPESP